MIKFADQVPSIYTGASRDFQYLSWLMDIVLNSVKHNVDDIYNLPDNKADPKLTELLALTLGFNVKRNYDQEQLKAIVAALPRILKYKGTKTAIEMAGNALIAASGASGDFFCEVTGGAELKITFPVNLIDISLFTDLLEYILPAGMTYHIIRQNQEKTLFNTKLGLEEALYAKWVPDVDWDPTNTLPTGLSNIYEVKPGVNPVFTNYIDNDINTPNIGLFSNTVIPMVREQMREPDYIEKKQEDENKSAIINRYTTEKNDTGTTVIIGGDNKI